MGCGPSRTTVVLPLRPAQYSDFVHEGSKHEESPRDFAKQPSSIREKNSSPLPEVNDSEKVVVREEVPESDKKPNNNVRRSWLESATESFRRTSSQKQEAGVGPGQPTVTPSSKLSKKQSNNGTERRLRVNFHMATLENISVLWNEYNCLAKLRETAPDTIFSVERKADKTRWMMRIVKTKKEEFRDDFLDKNGMALPSGGSLRANCKCMANLAHPNICSVEKAFLASSETVEAVVQILEAGDSLLPDYLKEARKSAQEGNENSIGFNSSSRFKNARLSCTTSLHQWHPEAWTSSPTRISSCSIDEGRAKVIVRQILGALRHIHTHKLFLRVLEPKDIAVCKQAMPAMASSIVRRSLTSTPSLHVGAGQNAEDSISSRPSMNSGKLRVMLLNAGQARPPGDCSQVRHFGSPYLAPELRKRSGTLEESLLLSETKLEEILSTTNSELDNEASQSLVDDDRADVWSAAVLALELICGRIPLEVASPSGDGVDVAAVLENTPGAVSKEALDFFSATLEKDPLKRLPVLKCLNHPWLRSKPFSVSA